ncbi:hypothetical protein L3556_03405 [Candidatus Synechococcus calcipolaris G9]|uniref:Glycosyl transferase family 1 domain-containing protein n=1 Tax=Candidatus Synechococcus calcipolaris G9 TaxID=1497997 RepID=A0ABT6EW23_9SYNE|nr:hypothetical protein [Candidatus Synechococcus calcipolaris]MDG2989984.1 hypothetical protein [Candidatus Synechococcus calcipolaris G9]
MKRLLLLLIELLYLPCLFILCFISRFINKKIDIGLGPEPLINNIYHKKALQAYNYTAETFVTQTYFIVKDFDRKFIFSNKFASIFFLRILHIDFLYLIFTYKCLYSYFNGCLLNSSILWTFEPYLLKVANIKIILMPYGADIQDLIRTPNLVFRHAMSSDYPLHRLKNKLISRKIDFWIKNASHIISGCDWVDYMYHWDTLMVAHFSIDTSLYKYLSPLEKTNNSKFRILHAPNHRNIKGTQFVIEAIESLQKDGEDIDLILLEKVSNQEVLHEIQKADLVIDQLIIGWYAMFAIESMVLSKPVICYLRDDLLYLYRCAGLISSDEPPLINSNPLSLKADLKRVIHDPNYLSLMSKKGKAYVEKVHSIHAVGAVFDTINRSIDLHPSTK